MGVEAEVPGSDPASKFNFDRAGLVANEQLRSLRMLDEQFARNLTHTLGAWLRTNATVQPLAALQLPFSRFMEDTSKGTYVIPLRMDPLGVRVAMSVDLRLAPALIDLLLGGSGRIASTDRELTEIEEAVLGSVLEIILREWTATWSPFGVEFIQEQRERDSQGKRMMPLQEKTLVIRFSINLAEISGELLFCVPSAAVTSTMKAVSHSRDRNRRAPEDRTRMEARLGKAITMAHLHLPAMRLFAHQLRSLQPGSVLQLPLQRATTAELRVGGVAVYRAEPVRANDRKAARLLGRADTPAPEGGKA